MNRREAEHAAEGLLARHRITDVPVPVERLAGRAGAQLVRRRFSGGQSGFIYRDGDLTIIGVNSSTSLRRQRFTIAHELGHMVLHDDPLRLDKAVQFRDEVSSLAVDPEEMDANAFAAALLMPEAQVVKHVRAEIAAGVTARGRLVSRLAKAFNVSAEAMGYRLINLGVLSS